MRLSTIWTIPSMSTMERLSRTKEWALIETAARLPKRLKYWVVINVAANAVDSYPAEATVKQVLDSLDHK